MFSNRVLKAAIIALIAIMFAQDMEAQRRTRTTTRDRSTNRERTRDSREPTADDLKQWYAISLGTLGFGNSFSISGKFAYGAKFQNRFSAGAFGKIFYDLVNFRNAPDVGLISYGGGAFARVNITDDIFIHGEYGYTDFEEINQNLTDFREGIVYPSIGGGYKSGFADWTYGFHVLLPLDDRARDFISLEYWIDFNHKF